MDVSNSGSDSEEDEIISRVPIFLTKPTEEEERQFHYVLTYPLRQASRQVSRDGGALSEVKIRPHQRKIMHTYEKFKHVGHSNEHATFDAEQYVLVGKTVLTHANHCIARQVDGALHFVPVHAMCRMTPDTTYIDDHDEKIGMNQPGYSRSYNRDKFFARVKQKQRKSKSERSNAYFKLSYSYWSGVCETEAWYACAVRQDKKKTHLAAIVCDEQKAEHLAAPGMSIAEYVDLAVTGDTRYSPDGLAASSFASSSSASSSSSSSSSSSLFATSVAPPSKATSFKNTPDPVVTSLEDLKHHVLGLLERARALTTAQAIVALKIKSVSLFQELMRQLPLYAHLLHGVWVLKTIHARNVESSHRMLRDQLIVSLWKKGKVKREDFDVSIPYSERVFDELCVFDAEDREFSLKTVCEDDFEAHHVEYVKQQNELMQMMKKELKERIRHNKSSAISLRGSPAITPVSSSMPDVSPIVDITSSSSSAGGAVITPSGGVIPERKLDQEDVNSITNACRELLTRQSPLPVIEITNGVRIRLNRLDNDDILVAHVQEVLRHSELSLNEDDTVFALKQTSIDDLDIDRVRVIAAKLFQQREKVKKTTIKKAVEDAGIAWEGRRWNKVIQEFAVSSNAAWTIKTDFNPEPIKLTKKQSGKGRGKRR